MQHCVGMLKINRLFSCLCILTSIAGAVFISRSAEAQTDLKFDSRGNPKSQGIWITVKYPQGWEAKEGERPNIVKKFVLNKPTYSVMMMLQVKKVPKEAIPEMPNLSIADWTEVFSELTPGAIATGIKKIHHENRPGVIGDVTMKLERAGISAWQKQRIMYIFFKDVMIGAWCGVVGYPTLSKEQVASQFELYANECFKFINSLTLMDQY